MEQQRSTGSFVWVYPVAFVLSLIILAAGVYLVAKQQLVALLACGLRQRHRRFGRWPLALTIQANRQCNEDQIKAAFTPINERLEQYSVMLNHDQRAAAPQRPGQERRVPRKGSRCRSPRRSGRNRQAGLGSGPRARATKWNGHTATARRPTVSASRSTPLTTVLASPDRRRRRGHRSSHAFGAVGRPLARGGPALARCSRTTSR